MSGVVEQTAGLMGWSIARTNIIVEGTSDVAFLTRASELHAEKHGRPLLDADMAVIAAGRRDDGGVEGVLRRLSMFMQLADVDRDANGAVRFKFVGLMDYDNAGRKAFTTADPRMARFEDLFMLRPVMPTFPFGYDRPMEIGRVNQPFQSLDWEIEDLCSARIMAMFSSGFPSAVLNSVEVGDFTHWDIDPGFKAELRKLFIGQATFADAIGFIQLLKMMREYLALPCDFVRT